MLDAGISTRRGIMCIHREPAYQQEGWSCGITEKPCQCKPSQCDRLIESEYAQDQAILLPLFYPMTEAQQDQVIRCLAGVV